MSLFRLDASIRVEGSHSREIADIVEREWRAAHPDDPIVRRHVGTDALPSTVWGEAASARFLPVGTLSDPQRSAAALAARLTDELVEADALLFAVPLYNYGVSQHFKTWVDTVLADPRMASGAPPLLAGKPAVLVTVRGGGYGPGTPRAGWDHATPWMRRILADVWQLDLEVVESELTLVGVDPNLERFRDLAAELRGRAEELAREHGRALL
ncbi:FMN-dependent NADH-azoreductase [Asanoa ferruginea]|uniref:FMN dependent NADH:quinone oxidoreductase n=1 Tax=Asanoa ferruginea TaxID=53367 RepID=A0A3D9ZP46_9ACTN|nr:NAD(P)H-dependent oxidoreductase [Asanoa ferruginea]REF98272.1 FMN-dependent NADH-azoreductase [Asanoa ferruginea]GIF50536.1 FMN-dependent NADH-azoreductase [Asanoa ferruginea]